MSTARTNENGDGSGGRRHPTTNHHHRRPSCSPPSTSSSTVTAHKKTPAAAWKDALRRSCVERARHHQRRRASESPRGTAAYTAGRRLVASTMSPSPSSSWNGVVGPRPPVPVDGAPSPLPLVASPDPPLQPWIAAQEAVAQTLQHWGVTVSVGTPMKANHRHSDDPSNYASSSPSSSSSTLLVLDGEYCMTEEEWYELLQDVEDDLKRAEEAQLDDMLDDERRYLEEQVADYERWQEQEEEDRRRGRCVVDGDGADHISLSFGHAVVCPLCQDAPLAQTPDGSLTCPNRMDGSCPLHLEARPGLSLSSLRHSLAAAFDEHNNAAAASQGCLTPLRFEAVSRPAGGTSLVAYCPSCRGSKLVA